MLYPNGTIMTDIVSLQDGVVVMKATARDENGKVLGTGLAYEKEGSSNVNRTSFIENCETSAVGRALGFVGIGIDTSIASAEEVINATIRASEEKSKPKPEAKPKPKPETKPTGGKGETLDAKWNGHKCEWCGTEIDPQVAKYTYENTGHFFCSGTHAQRWLADRKEKGIL